MATDLTLTAGDYRLVLAPDRGGSVSRFDHRGRPIFRPTDGPTPLDTACFPLVPFSNRIAYGRFYDGDRAIRLPPNFPGSDHPHTLHGFGWLAPWQVVNHEPTSALLRHSHVASEWPWPYVAEQHFVLTADGLTHSLSVTNLGDTAMPAGLGVHPYFPRDGATIYHGLHVSEWQTAGDGLPLLRERATGPIDWWKGRPVSQREVDTVYGDRVGPLTIDWRDGTRLEITPSDDLPFTVVYAPADRDFFCVEPVSHATDALNLRDAESGLRWLAPGEQFCASVRYRLHCSRVQTQPGQ